MISAATATVPSNKVAPSPDVPVFPLLHGLRCPLALLTQQLRVVDVNAAFCQLFGNPPDHWMGRTLPAFPTEPWKTLRVRAWLERLGRGDDVPLDLDVDYEPVSGQWGALRLSVSRVHSETVGPCLALSAEDVSESKRLQQEIVEISDREQRRIGQDLHDGVCQILTGLRFLLKVLKGKLVDRNKPQVTVKDITEIEQLVNQALSQTDSVAKGLYPVELEARGLMSALQELAAKTEKLYSVSCVFQCERPILIQDNVMATHLYRIAQEAVANAVKHGKATHIRVALSPLEEGFSLAVDDDGVGLAETSGRKGMGLRIMAYRAAVLDAELRVESLPKQGTRVVCVCAGRQPRKD